MHSHDRTLIARLGFSDPDRKDPRHDLACQYVVEQREQIARMALSDLSLKVTAEDLRHVAWRKADRAGFSCPTCGTRVGRGCRCNEIDAAIAKKFGVSAGDLRIVCDMHAECEQIIQKGEGQYRTTIGFADVYITGHRVVQLGGERYLGYPERAIGVEVKIQPISWAEVLRQIRLYAEYLPAEVWVLAAAYAVSASDVEMLQANDVMTVRLGSKFETWAKAQAKKPRKSTAREI